MQLTENSQVQFHSELPSDQSKKKINLKKSPNNKFIIAGGSYIYRKGYFPIVKANDFQPITFPIVGGPPFPIIRKVLYGVPGHDIDMTEWFKNYYVQNQVNGRLDNHQIMFHHIYGDPLFVSFLIKNQTKCCKTIQSYLYLCKFCVNFLVGSSNSH
jgi:hypothetical protein